MIRSVPRTHAHLTGGRTLDPERPDSEASRTPGQPAPGAPGEPAAGATPPGASGSGSAGAPGAPGAGGSGSAGAGATRPGPKPRGTEPPPGLRAQVHAFREAAMAFAQAHVNLLRVELEGIKGEVARASGLALVAILCVIFTIFLIVIAGFLFIGAVVYGSMGWGILLGTELLVAAAITAVLVALRIPGLGRQVLLALIPGLAVFLVFLFYLPNRLFAWIGESLSLAIDPAFRPLVVGVTICAILGALIGGAIGLRAGRTAGATIGAAVAGFFLGIIAGAFLSITFDWQAAFALGTATFLACWPAFMGLQAQRQGIDTEELAARFYPKTTIETTKESIEWAKSRLPGAPKP